MDMIYTFDIDLLKGRSFGLFPLAHVDPETIIEELEGIFYQKGKGDDSEFFKFMPIARLNSVLAVTRQAHYLTDIEDWVYRLDKANTASGGGVNVYKVQHVDAGELADTLNDIFTDGKSQSKSAKVAPGEKAESISNDESLSSRATGSPGLDSQLSSNTSPSESNSSMSGNLGVFAANEAEKKSPLSDAATGTIKVSNVGKVKIIADEPNNSVIIVASAQDYEVILPVIEQLDVMPLQVLIDATVVQVKLTDKLQYGISWYLDSGGSTTLINSVAPLAAASATGGLSTFLNAGSVKALLKAEASLNNINIISSPSLMVLNNQKARINVGDQVPVSTGSTSVPLGTGDTPTFSQSNTIQYKDTGVTLEVSPRVNAGGLVTMKLKQIVSSVVPVKEATTTQQQSPTINKKEITSSVAVNDGETIVLGGLISDDIADNKNGVPFFYQLPIIGALFGATDKTDIKTELVILITPRVVKSKQDSRVISNEFKRKLTSIYKEEVTDGINNLGGEERFIQQLNP
jgi:general secretion pathway protein D